MITGCNCPLCTGHWVPGGGQPGPMPKPVFPPRGTSPWKPVSNALSPSWEAERAIEDGISRYSAQPQAGEYMLRGHNVPPHIYAALAPLPIPALCASDLRNFSKGLTDAVNADPVTRTLPAALLLRSLVVAGWQILHTENEMGQYYVALWAKRQLERLDAPPQDSGKRAPGAMEGFQERKLAPDWDFVVGKLIGYRSMGWAKSYTELVGAQGKNFLGFKPDAGGRRQGECRTQMGAILHDRVPADEDCGCGWWGYWDAEVASKHYLGSRTEIHSKHLVAVEGSGRVVIGQNGWRSEYLKIIGAVVPATMTDRPEVAFGMYLPDVPLYGNSKALREAVGRDPVYGSVEVRYPELARFSTGELLSYERFLTVQYRNLESAVQRGSGYAGWVEASVSFLGAATVAAKDTVRAELDLISDLLKGRADIMEGRRALAYLDDPVAGLQFSNDPEWSWRMKQLSMMPPMYTGPVPPVDPPFPSLGV